MSQHSAIPFVLAALFVASAAACDPVESPKQDAKAAGSVAGAVKSEPAADPAKAAGAAGGAAASAVAAAAPAAGDAGDVTRQRQILGDYESCAQSCYAEAGAKETDVETCRLNCTTVAETAGVAAGTPAHRLMSRYDVCLGECYVEKNVKETDRETCKLNCTAVLDTLEAELKGGAAPPATGGTVTTECAQKCVTEATNCQRACGEARVKETDRATCNLTCTTNSDLCLEKCGEAGARTAPGAK